MTIKTLWRGFLKLTLPVDCLGCGQEGDWICSDCLERLVFSRSDRCCLCGKAADDGLCERHRRQTGLDGAVSLFDYKQTAIQNLVKAVKYHGMTDGLGFFIEKYRLEIEMRLPKRNWSFVPIPLERKRLVKRGFNQAQVLAKLLSVRRYPIVNLIKRNRSTKPQVELERKERFKNVQDCFSWRGTLACPEKVVLFDDVITTGSTLKEAAKVLRRHGAKNIWAVTIAHG